MGAVSLFVIGASAGGLEALRRIVSALPADFPAAICVVVHVAPDSPGLIPEILSSAGDLPAAHGRDQEQLAPGRIYVAPPDHHLLVDAKGRILLGRGPKENRFRPAVDPLFRSAALAFGDRVAGVILSGGLDDGAAGLAAIKRCGGAAIVQDPDDAITPSMPRAALRAVEADACLPAAGIAQAMTALAREYQPPSREDRSVNDLDKEVGYAAGDVKHLADVVQLGDPSMFTCPECHGVMVALRDPSPLRFRCHTGHAFTVASLTHAVEENVEASLFGAARVLEEYAGLNEALAKAEAGEDGEARERRDRYLQEAGEAVRRAHLVRQALKPANT